jgi:gliding motility-associated-like protein
MTACCNVTSAGSIAANGSGCAPFDPPLITSASLPTGGIGTLEYVWLTRPGTSGSWSIIAGANGPSYDPGVITTTTQYRRCARRSGCTDYVGESNDITMTVTGPCCDNVTNGGVIAANQSNCGPFDVALLTNVSSPTGGLGNLDIVWITRTGLSGTWNMIPGATGLTYDPGVVSETTQFRRCARRAGCVDYVGESNIITITVNPTFTLSCNSTNATAYQASNGSVGIIVSGGTASFTYVWNTGATTASIANVPAGVYSVTVTDANGCQQFSECCVENPSVCTGFRTQTQGGWGSTPNGGNPGAYLHTNFTTAFPSGIEIGCTNKFRFTSAQAITNFLPAGGTAAGLPSGIQTNPTSGNVLAGQVLALSISVGFDNAISNFGSSSILLKDLIVRSGTFAGWTVQQVLTEANNKIGGCASSYSFSQLNEIVTAINENYVDGGTTGNILECCLISLSCSKVDGTCANNNVASASVSASAGTAPYTYLWSNGATTASISNLTAGSYSVTVTDANGCTATCSTSVSNIPCCNVTGPGSIAADGENCGPFDPPAFTNVSSPTGGLGALEIVWITRPGTSGSWNMIPGATGLTYDPGMVTTTTQFRRCARRAGCTDYVGESNIITITINPQPVATCTPTNGTCANSNAASASVSATGGTAPYTYLWSTGATTVSISNLTAGSYSVTVTDVNGCSDECSVTVTSTPCCNVTDPGSVAGSQSNCGPFDPAAFTSVSPASGGLGDVVYQWYQKETETAWMPIPGANGATYDPGMISINSQFKRCAKRVGCPEFEVCSDELEIEIFPTPIVSCTKIDGTCSNGNLGSVSVTVQGGTAPYTYLWSNGVTTSGINGLSAGTYSVTITDQNGCEATCSKTISVNPCCNVNNGGTIAGNQENCGPFDPSAITSTTLPSGGLGDLEYVWLWNPNNVAFNNGSNGWVEIPNSNSSTYDPGMLSASRCFIRCSRRSGCTDYPGESNVICIAINESPVAICSSTDSECNGSGSGTASVSVSGGEAPYTYSWSNGGTTSTISGLMAGSYSVTITDANGCIDECSVSVGEPSGLTATCDAIDATCNGVQDGRLSVSALGGSEPYSYSWSNGATTSIVFGVGAGTYGVTITDANGCIATCSSLVEQPSALSATCSKVDGNCQNNNEGSVSVSISGGDEPYSYVWSNGATTASISGLAAGTYSVIITDANGCEATCSNTVSVTPCCNVNNGGTIAGNQQNCGPFDPSAFTSVTLPSGGLGDVEYVWLWNPNNVAFNNGGNGWVEIPNSNSSTYDPGMLSASRCFIRCSRRSGCTDYPGESNVICVTVNPVPVAVCTPVNGNCGNGNVASASVSVSNGTAPYAYAWSNGATTASIADIAAGTYSVTVTDANGCTTDCSVTVSNTPCCNVTDGGEISADQENCGPFDPAAITSTTLPSGGLGDLEYVWLWNPNNVAFNNGNNGWVEIPNSNSSTYDPGMLSASRCFIRCSRRSGCNNYVGESNVVCVTINPVPVATCTPVNGDCNNGNAASASVSASNGTAPYTYLWSNGATTASISGLATGSYSVTVTDANGCAAVCSTSVQVVGCCNVTGPGSIAANQSNCGPFDAAELTSTSDPSGGLGDLEIVWITRTGTSGPWQIIPGATGFTYDPGVVSVTTQFRRCARRAGCSDYVGETNIITITIFSQPEVVCNPTHGDCFNNGIGAVSTSISGGTAPFTYAWSNGATTADISGLAAGTYSVSITDANGCTSDCSVNITSEPCCNVTDGGSIAGAQENCGPFDPAAITSSVPATGGIGPVEYVWLWNSQNVPLNNGQNGWVEIPNSNSATYDPGFLTESRCFIRCSRNAGCEPYIGESNVVCVTIHPEPIAVCTPVNGDCTNDNMASASVTVSSGTAPFTYAWSNGATTASIADIAAGTYSVTVTDANGCTDECSVTVSITPCCNVTTGGEIAADQENCGPFDPAAIVSVQDPTGGLGNLEYVWLWNPNNVAFNNGNNGWVEIPNSNSSTYDPGMLTSSRCFIRCSRRIGCDNYVGESNVVCVTINPVPVAACTPVNGNCNNGNVASASVSVSNGTAPYTYAWSNGATTASIEDIAAGTYSVTVTDANGCTDECSVEVSTTPCCNVTYGGEIAANQENCGPFDPAAITSIAAATGGLGGLEYIWLMNSENVPLNNGQNGWVEIPNSNSESFDPGMLTESTCFIRCARREGCEVYIGESNVVCITVNPQVEIECSSIAGDCSNGNVASASVDVVNGTAPYTYAWSNGATTASITNLAEGTYTVTVSDANGCSATCSEEVILTPCCNVTDSGEIAASQESCVAFDPAPFTSVAPATGGIGTVEYLWLSGTCGTPVSTWTALPNSNSATYDAGMITETTCFIRCARNSGCEPWIGESNIITITIQNMLAIECSSISGDCGNGNVASAFVDVTAGTGPYTYLWSNGETTASISDLEEGIYTVTVTDANGCSASCSESVIVTPCCNVTDAGEIADSQENCGAFDPAPFTSITPATGGIGTVEYVWLSGVCGTPVSTWTALPNSNSASYDAGMITETTCFIRCARNSGCEPWVGESNIITVTVYPAVELSCNGVNGDCSNNNNARAIAHISGGTEPYTVAWSNGGTTATIENLVAGTYSVLVTDANGCEAECSVTVEVTPCCNVTDGGQIADNQENCGAFDPSEIVSVTPATGGIGPVEYAWYSGPCDQNTDPTIGEQAIPAGFSLIAGATGESYDPAMLSETTCFIRVARNQGCEEWLGESNIITITINNAPELVCSSVNGDCENGNVGSASVSVSGAPSPFSYSWSNGATTASIENLVAGTYSVVVTDGNGCVDSCSASVEITPCCNVTDGGQIADNQENCGPFDPSEIVSVTPATGGIGPVEYAWYSGPCDQNTDPTIGEQAIPAGFSLIAGATGESYDPAMLSETTCFIRVARNQGCEEWLGESNIITITINNAPELVCSSVNGDCENGNVGSASVSVSGAPSPFSYSWSNGATTASIENLVAGTYSVVVTDGNGCVDSCSASVEITPCCNVTDGGQIADNQENCGPFDPSEIVSVTPATGGIGPVEYAWYSGPCPTNDPTLIPAGFNLIAGANGASYDPEFLTSTTCFIRVARNAGCTEWIGESNIITITVNGIPTVDIAITGGVNPTCDGGSVELTASSSTATSFEWSTGETDATISVTETEVYVVVAFDGNECSATDSISIEVLPNPELEIEVDGGNPICSSDSTMLTANCATAVGYSWSNGSTGPSIWVTEVGTYSVEVADANGCTATASLEVEVYDLPEVQVTINGNNPLCVGDSAILIAVSQGAMSYEWSNGATTQSIWVYGAGTYSVTVVDEVGCENSLSYEVLQGLTPLIDITGDSTACAGGSIVLTAQYAGGEGVVWSTGETTQSITVTQSGEYCVTTVSLDGCEASACSDIDIYPTLEVEVQITTGNNPFCVGDSIELIAVTQNATSFSWSNGSTDASIWVTEQGTYGVEITDANGCTASSDIAVTTVDVPVVVIQGPTEVCTGDSIMLTAVAGNGVSYQWSNGETTQSIWVYTSGEYCVTATSSFGCVAEVCVTISGSDIPEVFAGEDVNICVGDNVMLTATGGNAGTTYTWYVDGNVVGNTQSITISPAVGLTEYTVVSSNEFCSIESSDVVKVWVHAYPIAGFERDPAGDVPFGSDVQFTDTTLGLVTDWHWDFGDGLTSMIQHPDHNYAGPGSYWVTLIASNNGCADTVVHGLEVKVIIDIPNVFTPNNDGINDVIWLQGTDIDLITMTIYNRWGFSVYASEGRQFSWSGKTSAGADCEAGTYYYVIGMKFKDGTMNEQTGFFTLLRD